MHMCTDSPSCVFQLAGMTGVKTIQVRGQVCTSGLVFCLLQYRQLGTRQSECLDACIAYCVSGCMGYCDPLSASGSRTGRKLGHVQGQSSWTTLYPAWGASYQTTSAGTAPLDVRLTPNDGGPPLVSTYALLAL